MRRIVTIGFLTAAAGLGVYSCLGETVFGPGLVFAYLLLMFCPGAALYLLLEKNPHPLELILTGSALSPVLTGSAGVLMIVFGAPAAASAAVITAASAGLLLFVLGFKKNILRPIGLSNHQILTLAAIVAAFCLAIGFLPLTREWWRLRSDAWFHLAVVAQIGDYGLPPEDPHFIGMPLQYMWFYHVLILVLSRATHVNPAWIMPLINIQAIFMYSLAAFMVSILFTRRFAHGIYSMVLAVLGINALFYLFLPIKLLRAFTGEVRGLEEVSRTLDLTPFDMYTVRSLVQIYGNQEWLFDKFIVATALATGIALMAVSWYFLAGGLKRKRPSMLLFLFLASVGMVAFHTIIGFSAIAGFIGGLILLQLTRARLKTAVPGNPMLFILAMLAAIAVLYPYLNVILRGKESSQLLPFGFSLVMVASIIVSCGLGILLAVFQLKKILSERTALSQFLILNTVAITLYSLIVQLPAGNAVDKFPFLIFFPLSIAGGWTLAELPGRWRGRFKRTLIMAALLIVLFLPLNLLQFLGYLYQPANALLGPGEAEAVAWVQTATPRDAVFIDSGDRLFLTPTAPRRYFWGSEKYAHQWGYNKKEMDRRLRVRDNLYSPDPIDGSTLDALGRLNAETYIIVRSGEPGASGPGKFAGLPDIFSQLFSAEPITIFRVDRDQCRHLAAPTQE